MALAQTNRSQGGRFRGDHRSSFSRHRQTSINNAASTNNKRYNSFDNQFKNFDNYSFDFPRNFMEHNYHNSYYYGNYANHNSYYGNSAEAQLAPSTKRRKFSACAWENSMRPHMQPHVYKDGPSINSNSSVPVGSTRFDANACLPPTSKCDCSKFEGEDVVFLSRDEIERCSPSRKDGIDAQHEKHLRYSYCSFLQNLGTQLEIPQSTIGTAMVLCHRFFVRRSHACHDRFLIATAALFLAAKSEETACPLISILKASCEILHNQDFTLLSYRLPVDWFEKHRERVIEAEHIILTTLNFELHVQHPYGPLTSILHKLGLSQSILVNWALSLVSEGLRSSLWLQFKPHEIAAGVAYLAAKFINMDLTSSQHVWQELQTPPSVLKDVAQQLVELF